MRVFPERAAIDHALVEHRFVELVAQVVVFLGDLEDSRATLVIDDCRSQPRDCVAPASRSFVEPGGEQPVDEAVQIAHIPPSVHVRLAESQRAFGKYPRVEVIVVYLDVPGVGAVDVDAALAKQAFDAPPKAGIP